jgi:uncharacterized protein with HEPN domain
MKQPDDEALLVDILLAASEARTLCSDLDYEEFLLDRALQLAIQKLIEVIGEAATRLSAETRGELSTLPWREIVAMRNRLVHDYRNVNFDKVWEVVEGDLEPLIAAIEAIVPPPTGAESF